MSTLVKKLKKKGESFKKTFNRKERIMIIIGCIATLIIAISIWVIFFKVTAWAINELFELTAPPVKKALDTLTGILFEGWTFF